MSERGGAVVRWTVRVSVVVGFALWASTWPGGCGGGGEGWDPWYGDGGADSRGWDTPVDARDDARSWDAANEAGPEDVYVPPEEEETPDFRAPQASNRFVYLSNTLADNVVVIDSQTLAVDLVSVGDAPTSLAALGMLDAAAVINSGSDTLSYIRTRSLGAAMTSDVIEEAIAPNANVLSASPSGLYGVTYYDVEVAGLESLSSDLQDVSLVAFEGESMWVLETSTASRPIEVEWSDDGTRAFIVAEHHVCPVDFVVRPTGRPRCASFGMVPSRPDDPGSPMIPRPVDEVDVSSDGRVAVLRAVDVARIDVLDMTTEAVVEVPLPAVPSDVDLARNGTFALAALRNTGQVALVDLSDLAAPEVFVTTVPGMLAGQVVISPDASRAVVFSSVTRTEMPTALTEVLGVLDIETGDVFLVPLQKEVRAVAITPDNAIAVVIHRKLPGSPDDPSLDPVEDLAERIDRSYGFSLVELDTGWASLHLTSTDPGPFLVYDDTDAGIRKAFLTLRDDRLGVREVLVANLETFTARRTPLGSPPASVGIAPATHKVFVGQDHPTGRITFVDALDGSVQTVTGFQINDWIVE